jgi:predicted Zn finger-like uncharacterized protein
MPIATTCPNCKAAFRLAETLAGKKVRCQKCRQVFVVPVPEASPPPPPPAPKPSETVPAPEPPVLAPPLAAPPISLSLDDEPVQASVVQPPAAPTGEVFDAILVDPPKEAEIIEATVIAPPAEPIIEAKLAEPEIEKTPRKSSREASSEKRRPRRAADLPKHSTTGAGFLAALGIFLIAMVIVGAFAGILLLINWNRDRNNRVVMPPPPMPMPMPMPNVKQADKNRRDREEFKDKDREKAKDFDRKDGPKNIEEKQLPVKKDVSRQLFFEPDGTATSADHTGQDGITYRVRLKPHKQYNLIVNRASFPVRVRVFHDEGNVVTVDGRGGAAIGFLTPFDTECKIHVSSKDPNKQGFFLLRLGLANFSQQVINLEPGETFSTKREFRIGNEIRPGTGRLVEAYTLKVMPGSKYRIKVISEGIIPYLQINGLGKVLKDSLAKKRGDSIDEAFTAPKEVNEVELRVISNDNELGKYSLEVTRAADGKDELIDGDLENEQGCFGGATLPKVLSIEFPKDIREKKDPKN